MAVSRYGVFDLAALAGLELFPLSLLSDGNSSTPDLALEGELGVGGAYAYELSLAPGQEYRFDTSGAEDGFAERAMLVDDASGAIVWANAAAAQGFGYDPSAGAQLADQPLVVDAAGEHTLIVWADPASSSTQPQRFLVEADADPIRVTDDAVFRFYDPARQIERLTANVQERDQLIAERPDLRYDGVAFVGDDSARDGWVGVFEVLDYVTGQRYYTASADERNALVASLPSAGDQGIAFWVPGHAGENTESVYKLTHLDTGAWFLTANQNERLFLLLQGNWADQGVAFNAWAPPPEPVAPAAADPATDVSLVGVADAAPPLI